MTRVPKLSIPGDVRYWGRLTDKVVIEQPSGYVVEAAGGVVQPTFRPKSLLLDERQNHEEG